jgi:hypothetical protein
MTSSNESLHVLPSSYESLHVIIIPSSYESLHAITSSYEAFMVEQAATNLQKPSCFNKHAATKAFMLKPPAANAFML